MLNPIGANQFFYDTNTLNPYYGEISTPVSIWNNGMDSLQIMNSMSIQNGLSYMTYLNNAINALKMNYQKMMLAFQGNLNNVNNNSSNNIINLNNSNVNNSPKTDDSAKEEDKTHESNEKTVSSVARVALSTIEDEGLKFLNQKRDRARWDDMNPTMQNALLKLVKFAKSKGITIYINSGKRTDGEQQNLVNSGAPAAPKGSKHLSGRAVDIRVSGNSSKNLAILGEYWRDELGYRWGADFKYPKPEPWHFDIGNKG